MLIHKDSRMNFLKSISKWIKSQHVNTRIDPNLVPPKPSRHPHVFFTVGFSGRKLTAGVSLWWLPEKPPPEPRKPADSGGFFGRFPAKKGDFAETDSGASWSVVERRPQGCGLAKWWVGWIFLHRSFFDSLNFQYVFIYFWVIFPGLVFGFKSLVRWHPTFHQAAIRMNHSC